MSSDAIIRVTETILIQDPHVKAAVMFGRGQFQNGILVDPKPEYSFDPVDEAKLVEFRNLIWCGSALDFMSSHTHTRLKALHRKDERVRTGPLPTFQGGKPVVHIRKVSRCMPVYMTTSLCTPR